jgi:TolB protein
MTNRDRTIRTLAPVLGLTLALGCSDPPTSADLAPGAPAFAKQSGNADQIAFASRRDGNSEIYVMNADGTGQINLTNHPADDLGPVWSPNGKQLVFFSRRDNGNGELYVMNADGTGLTNLTNHPAGDALFGATWSSNGKQIAFTTERDGIGNWEIYVMNADGTALTNLTNHPGLDSNPAWSSNGKQIAFASSRVVSGIYVMNADGTALTNLTNHGNSPQWRK